MFNNIGGKIKGFAKVVMWIGIIPSLILAINNSSYGLLIAIGGIIASIITGWFLYGLGELIDNTAVIIEYGKKIAENTELIAENSESPYVIKTVRKTKVIENDFDED